ncbi:hypothetical protein LX36DRAFT_341414 [Colletotrichum falcatum]|nr:hypothetical protein LX36DRAFT_341414 [Colletotrichum falcatum]
MHESGARVAKAKNKKLHDCGRQRQPIPVCGTRRHLTRYRVPSDPRLSVTDASGRQPRTVCFLSVSAASRTTLGRHLTTVGSGRPYSGRHRRFRYHLCSDCLSGKDSSFFFFFFFFFFADEGGNGVPQGFFQSPPRTSFCSAFLSQHDGRPAARVRAPSHTFETTAETLGIIQRKLSGTLEGGLASSMAIARSAKARRPSQPVCPPMHEMDSPSEPLAVEANGRARGRGSQPVCSLHRLHISLYTCMRLPKQAPRTYLIGTRPASRPPLFRQLTHSSCVCQPSLRQHFVKM